MLLQLCVLRRIEISSTRGSHIAVYSSLTSTKKCYRRTSVPSPSEILHGTMVTDTVQLSLLSLSVLRRSDLLVGRFDVFCSNLSWFGLPAISTDSVFQARGKAASSTCNISNSSTGCIARDSNSSLSLRLLSQHQPAAPSGSSAAQRLSRPSSCRSSPATP
jgi:hypothetical protein